MFDMMPIQSKLDEEESEDKRSVDLKRLVCENAGLAVSCYTGSS